MKNRDAETGPREVSKKIERRPCGFRTRLTVDDQVNSVFNLDVVQPWQCKNGERRTQ